MCAQRYEFDEIDFQIWADESDGCYVGWMKDPSGRIHPTAGVFFDEEAALAAAKTACLRYVVKLRTEASLNKNGTAAGNPGAF